MVKNSENLEKSKQIHKKKLLKIQKLFKFFNKSKNPKKNLIFFFKKSL